MVSGLSIRVAICLLAVMLGIWVLIPTFLGKDVQETLAAAALRAMDEDAPPPATPDPWWVDVLPNRKVNLGLDLQGGINLTLEVETEEAVLSTIQRDGQALKELAAKDGVKLEDVRRDRRAPELLVAPGEGVDLAAVQTLIRKQYDYYEYLNSRKVEGRTYLAFAMSEARQKEVSTNAVNQALETIRNRIDETGVKEPSITKKGERSIDLQLPGETDIERAEAAVGTTAKLEFMLVDEDADLSKASEGLLEAEKVLSPEDFADDGTLSEWLSDHHYLAPNRKLLWEYVKQDGANKRMSNVPLTTSPHVYIDGAPSPLVLKDEVVLTGDDVSDAQTSPDQKTQGYDVSLKFKPHGQSVFAEVTGANVKKRFAIVLDGQIKSAPTIQERINGDASISMGAGNIEEQLKEAGNLALVLRSGALPAPVSVGEARAISASLGQQAINEGIYATAAGSFLVFLFAALYYRISGVLANLSLLVNGLLVLALLAVVGATLTLPGICGIALTIGMAVDCNIIIYERIREELRAGKGVRAAIDAGFDRATVAVIDSNLTTLLAGVVLYSYGSGPLKGFAVTLMIGIFTTLFTGVFVSRTLMDLVFSGRRATVSI